VTFNNTSGNLFLRDTQINTTTLIVAQGATSVLSANGRYIAFVSFASDLVVGDTNNTNDIFLRDTQTNTTTRISVATDGTQGDAHSESPSISADGRYVAFMSWATNLVPEDYNPFNDVYVRDTQTNTTTRISVKTDGTQGYCNSLSSSISGDGRYVAFISSGQAHLVDGLLPLYLYLLLRDTQTNTTSLVSLVWDGLDGTFKADYGTPPAISNDGHYVAFHSGVSSLVPEDTNGVLSDIFRALAGTTFADVPSTYWAWGFIERLYNAGITGGCGASPLTYCPDATVTRAQMAIFLLRGMHGSSYSPPAVGGSTGFNDVAPTDFAAAWIKQLALEGITGGCGPSLYCPNATVTRAQMAIFLLRGEHGSAYVPPDVGASTDFNDVAPTDFAAAWIKQLAAEGITGGCAPSLYCPAGSVTRAEMEIFLVRAFSLP
jgi:Tol biopolymer transport system component